MLHGSMYYIASIVSEHVYKLAESGLPGVLDALKNDSTKSEQNTYTVQVTRLDVEQKYMVLETLDCIYVGMVGTKSLKDALVDGQVQRRSVPFPVLEKGAAHAGFLKRAMDIPIHALYRIACIVKGKQLVVCGHSLGGAISALSTWRLLSEMGALDSVKCITFGSPGVYEYGDTVGGDGIINFLAEDDPLSLLSNVSMYKHIGKVIMLPKTGVTSAEKHRMRYYRKYIADVFGSEDGHQIQGGVVLPPIEVCLVEGRHNPGNAMLYVDVWGDHLDFVRSIRLITSHGARVGIIKKQSVERIAAVFTKIPGKVISESQNLSVTLHTDFEVPNYPIKIKRPIIWVVYTYPRPDNHQPLGQNTFISGALVWDIVYDVDIQHGLDAINVCVGGNLDHVVGWLDKIKIARIARKKKKHCPFPDGILVMGRVEGTADVYHSLYTLVGTLNNSSACLIYNTDRILQEHEEYLIKTLTGIPKKNIISHGSMETAVQHTVLILHNVMNSKL